MDIALKFTKFAWLILFFLSLTNEARCQLHPGDVDPKAIQIDIDKSDNLEPFFEGYAVITKGNATGIIDSKGVFFVPFNKYSGFDHFVNGHINFSNKIGNNISGFLDAKGNEYTFSEAKNYVPTKAGGGYFDRYGYYEMRDFQGNYTLWNSKSGANFKKIYLPNNCQETYLDDLGYKTNRLDINNGLILYTDFNLRKHGYVTIQGIMKIKPQFDEAEAFSDGMAVVGNKNEFGELKYGFIDTTGKVVIPLMYNNKPGSFYYNRAYVKPSQKTDFFCGFINKTNELILKFSDYPLEPDFKDGLLLFYKNYHPFFIDTSGNKLDIVQHGMTNGVYYGNKVIYTTIYGATYAQGNTFKVVVNNQIMIAGKDINSSESLEGIMTMDGKIIVPPIFYKLSYFDPISHLAKAQYLIGDNKYIDGYKNEEGVFVIIKKQLSIW